MGHSIGGNTLARQVGTLLLKKAGKLSKRERRDVARWLRWHAKHLVKYGRAYAKRFTAGFTFYS